VNASAPLVLQALLGDYPLIHGGVSRPGIALDFAAVPRPSAAFKRVVRELAFDFSELAIVTYLIARAFDKPLVLLPAVVLARFQHPFIVYAAARGTMSPRDLYGGRVGIRSYSVTTVAWIRGILSELGVDSDCITWVTFEEPHVAEFVDPPNVARARAGTSPVEMLIAGELDAAVLGEVTDDARLKPLFPDAEQVARAWYQAHRALQINHMVVVKSSLARNRPDIVRDLYGMLEESKRKAGLPDPARLDTNPMGWDANRRNLEVAIDYVYRQRLIPRRFDVDELIVDTTRDLR